MRAIPYWSSGSKKEHEHPNQTVNTTNAATGKCKVKKSVTNYFMQNVFSIVSASDS